MHSYIIRHADKETGDFYNPALRHQDQPISVKGRQDAEGLVSFFINRPISKIFVSEYIRTHQTIKPLSDKYKILPIEDNRLNEIDNGLIEGLKEGEVKERFPDTWEAFQNKDRDFRFPEGESGEDVLNRIKSFFDDIKTVGEDIIIVSHDGWIRSLMCFILGLPIYRRWDFQVDTCGIMEIEYLPGYDSWKLLRFNHLCH